MKVQAVDLLRLAILRDNVRDLLAECIQGLHDFLVALAGDAHGDAGHVPFGEGQADGVQRELAHLALQVPGGDRERVRGVYGDGLVGLAVGIVVVLFQQAHFLQKGQGLDNVVGRNELLAGLGHFGGLRSGHCGGEFPDDGVLPGFVVVELVGAENPGLVLLRYGAHFFKGGFPGLVVFCRAVGDHCLEIDGVEAGQPHCRGDGCRARAAQVLFSLANVLEEDGRGKSGRLGKIPPCEGGSSLFFVVKVLNDFSIISVFNNRLHIHKTT